MSKCTGQNSNYWFSIIIIQLQHLYIHTYTDRMISYTMSYIVTRRQLVLFVQCIILDYVMHLIVNSEFFAHVIKIAQSIQA